MRARGDNNHPFHLQDISVVTPNRTFNAVAATKDQLQAVTAANLLFATQKNGECGKTVMQGDTSSALLSPVRTLVCRICHLHSVNASADTPVCTAFVDGIPNCFTPSLSPAALHTSCSAIGNSLGLHPHDISARALRASRAMALL